MENCEVVEQHITFDDVYPNALASDQPEHEDVMRGSIWQPCYQCKQLTHWLSLSFECPVCSPKCEAYMWETYWTAIKNSEYWDD